MIEKMKMWADLNHKRATQIAFTLIWAGCILALGPWILVALLGGFYLDQIVDR